MTLVLAATLLLSTVTSEVEQYANEAGVDPVDLMGAVLTTNMDPESYLIAVGMKEAPPPQRDWMDGLLDCIRWHESRNVNTAVNPRSGASGPYQFLPSTWRTTPQGRAGMSVFDPGASRAAARWMINQGRGREWAVWGMCA